MKKSNLENRIEDFAAEVITIVENLPESISNNHLGMQLVQSSTTAALRYGEAQGANNRAEFIQKMKTALQSLRETFVYLRILKKAVSRDTGNFRMTYQENDELIAIFISSLSTAQKNALKVA